MLERLSVKGADASERRAALRRAMIADAARATGIPAEIEGELVVLSGCGLARRLALTPRLRWQVMEVRDER